MRLDSSVRIPVFEPLRAVNRALLELLRGFSADDWNRPTVHRDRSVKDLATHLLQGSLQRVSMLRDGWVAPMPPIRGTADLTEFIQAGNREFMAGLRRVSPQILIELIAGYDPEMVRLFEALDPDAAGLGVMWAGETISRNWFDVAREYTEKWHHQQQLRDATGRPPLYAPELVGPVLETFARGLPYAYRDAAAPDETCVTIAIRGAVALGWTLRRAGDGWTLWRGETSPAATRLALDADVAWRLWTKGLDAERARIGVEVIGDDALAEPLRRFVAIMA